MRRVLLVIVAACGKRDDAPPAPAAVVASPPATRALLDATRETWSAKLVAWHRAGELFDVTCTDTSPVPIVARWLEQGHEVDLLLDPAMAATDPHVEALLHLAEALRRADEPIAKGLGVDLALRVATWAHDHALALPIAARYPLAPDFALAFGRARAACNLARAQTATEATLQMTPAEYRQGRIEAGMDPDVTLDHELPMLVGFARETLRAMNQATTLPELLAACNLRDELATTQTTSLAVRATVEGCLLITDVAGQIATYGKLLR